MRRSFTSQNYRRKYNNNSKFICDDSEEQIQLTSPSSSSSAHFVDNHLPSRRTEMDSVQRRACLRVFANAVKGAQEQEVRVADDGGGGSGSVISGSDLPEPIRQPQQHRHAHASNLPDPLQHRRACARMLTSALKDTQKGRADEGNGSQTTAAGHPDPEERKRKLADKRRGVFSTMHVEERAQALSGPKKRLSNSDNNSNKSSSIGERELPNGDLSRERITISSNCHKLIKPSFSCEVVKISVPIKNEVSARPVRKKPEPVPAMKKITKRIGVKRKRKSDLVFKRPATVTDEPTAVISSSPIRINGHRPKRAPVKPPSPVVAIEQQVVGEDSPSRRQSESESTEEQEEKPTKKKKKQVWKRIESLESQLLEKKQLPLRSLIRAPSLQQIDSEPLPAHAEPRKTPRIQWTLDRSTTIAPFFTKAFCFSNHFKCYFIVDGLRFCCTEQFYMYFKAIVFRDDEAANKIIRMTEPAEMKRIGSRVRLFNTSKWRKLSILVMMIGNLKKYEQNPQLRRLLFETGDSLLVEASPDDIYWGVGIGVDSAAIRDIQNWPGKNVLGRVLTQIREELKTRTEYREEWEAIRRQLPRQNQ